MSRSAASVEAQRVFRGRKLTAVHVWFGGHRPDEGCAAVYRLVFDERHRLVALELLPVAACPFVYSLSERPIFKGEILRNLADARLEQQNSLSISTPQCGGVARFRISEEKDEVTSLDSVSLLVEGVEVRPEACATSDALYCVNDGHALRLAQGEHVDLAFFIPPAAKCKSFVLQANGHYTPNERGPTRRKTRP